MIDSLRKESSKIIFLRNFLIYQINGIEFKYFTISTDRCD